MKSVAISSMSKKICAILLTMLVLVGTLPIATVTVADAANARTKVVEYMRSMSTIKWKPKADIPYWSGGTRKYSKNTTYTGMPYTQNNRQNLAGFKKWVNSKGIYTGSATSGGYVGNDCSSAVISAWKQVSSTVTATYTGNMYPGGNGIVAVGSYSVDKTSTKKTVTKNGSAKMYAAYAKLQPGDAIMARVQDVVNHTRLVEKVSGNSVTVIEQCGLKSGATTTWKHVSYTFSQLYSTYYIPITVKELQGVSGEKPTGPSQLKISNYNTPSSLGVGKSFSIYGTITSNYDITSVTVGIYDSNGKGISTKTSKPNTTVFSVSSVDSSIKFGKAPAGTNYYKISATDQKTTKELVNKKYTVGSSSSGGGSSSKASTLTLTSYNYPTTLKVGKSFTISGTVSSNYKIKSLTVGVYNANGTGVSTKTVKPNTKSYSLKNVDAYVKFGAAKAGTNYYKITASDEKITKVLLNKAYTVTSGSTSAESTLTVTGYNYPSGTLKQGASFSIKGTVKSNYKIKNVTVGIYNANGGKVSTKSVTPNAKSYNIANIDAYIKFGAAKAGTNYYKISATDEKVTKTLVNKSYTVKSNDPASTLKATNCNYPTTLVEGKSFSIKGSVTSNYKITSVTVGIYNANGGKVSVKTVNPNAKSYNIANIDSYIKFGAAKAGTNYYKISAKDQKISKELVNQKYTVTAKQSEPSKLAISGHNTPPSTLNVGKSFSIKGKITSNYKITSVTVGIYDANGGKVSVKTVSPNSTSFNIATVDSYIKFGSAKAGTNYYKISAKDQKITKELVNSKFTVKSNEVASKLAISGHNVPPAELALGKSFTIKGTVSSNYNITSLTVGIYDANGGKVSVKTVNPNAKSYSIKNVDSYIKFGQAKAGVNYYKVTAKDQKITKELVNSKYKVVAPTVASNLSISGHNVPPAEMTLGKSFSIYGTVKSNYNITSLTVGIYNSNGGKVSTKTVSPNATSYSISKVDSYIKFGAAGKGVHYYKIEATDSKQTKVLVNSKYTVVTAPQQTDADLTGNYANDIVAVAKTQIGNSGRPNAYTRWYGSIGDPPTYAYAWCAAFTSWCANQAGIPKSIIPPEISCSRMVTAFQKLGSDIIKDPSYNPVKGDIIFFDTSASGTYNHVGIVVSYNSSTGAITTIEGNTSDTNHANGDTVAQKTRYRKSSGISVSAFAHPKYPAAKSSSSSKSSSDSSKPSGKTISAAQAKKIAGDITAAYEGGYTAVAGNSDGQGISVGFFQWNIGTGSLQPMLKKFLNNHASEAKSIFGEDKYNGLSTMLNMSSKSDQLTWVVNNIIVSGGTAVKSDWKTCLKNMCKTESFQAIEVEAAENWFNQGKVIFNRYKLTTLRSYCLCIDIAVQNWDPKSYMGNTSGKTEKQIQQMLVDAAVAKTSSKYKEDVRSRKSTIVNGSGVVHQTNFNLDRDYGLSDKVIVW